ncbi:hypothetical protein RJ639_019261 [Escallonia herrerae]|uniref:Pectinesterase catalytic domain-containing protein n=1 Tax=Escallonia herrerae TaxID=1293975 RepID=A0AA89AJA6_9ASTE|nr:hypothetical protein RJ639_019261 [Escallonia herrerae]
MMNDPVNGAPASVPVYADEMHRRPSWIYTNLTNLLKAGYVCVLLGLAVWQLVVLVSHRIKLHGSCDYSSVVAKSGRRDFSTVMDTVFITMATSETNPESGPVNHNVQHGDGTVVVAYSATISAQETFQFYRGCNTQGSKYFIYGAARALFQRCTIEATIEPPDEMALITGQSNKHDGTGNGFVFHLCKLSTVGSTLSKNFLGGPLGAFAKTVVMQSSLMPQLRVGWLMLLRQELYILVNTITVDPVKVPVQTPVAFGILIMNLLQRILP